MRSRARASACSRSSSAAAPEDREVRAVVKRAIDADESAGATTVEVTIPNLAAQLTASNLLTQELKFYLGDYLKKSGGPVASVEELLASGLHVAQLEGILDIANAERPTTTSTSDDYKRRLAARELLAQAVARSWTTTASTRSRIR